ncbi:centrosomal protein of 170 kDa protein B isoform 2-T2 [Spinachia spinachia]
MSVTSWFLVSSSGTRHRLPREMIFVGRDDCELMLQTFVNDLRIPDQTYITLKLSDVIRFGYDAHVYILERSQHKVPEEALKHEKYTSQLQLGIKAVQAKVKEKQQLHSSEKSKNGPVAKLLERVERKAHSLAAATDPPISKPTPLYGQPSWWGEDEDAAKKKKNRGGKLPEKESPAKDASRYDVNGSLSVNGALSDDRVKSLFSYRREPSYFEIPTKEPQQRPAKKPESQVHEVPTKDTAHPAQAVCSTPSVVQSHASFTIEFDECTPGKMKIKDHVTKFSFRQQPVVTPTEVMSAESKVADWLVHSNASMIRKRTQADDAYSTSSDPSVLNIPRTNQHEDGTRSDSEDPAIRGRGFLQSEPRLGYQALPPPPRASPPPRCASPVSEEPLSCSPPESQSLPGLVKPEPHQAFVIKFFDDTLRKKRSQSFTGNVSPPEPAGPRVQLDKAKKASSPTAEGRVPSSASGAPPTQQYTVPLKSPAPAGFQRAGSLRREKTLDRVSAGFSSRSSSSVSVKPFSSVGRRSKLAQEFTAEFLKQTKQASSAGSEKNASSPPPSYTSHQPQTSSPIHHPVPLGVPLMPVPSQAEEVQGPHVGAKNEEEDSLSDAGTYTIEADVQDKELEEARGKIDQVPPGGAVLQEAPKWMSCWASLADTYAESSPSSGLFDLSSQTELSGGARGTITRKATLGRHHDSADSDGSRARRVLPQVPLGEKSDGPTPSIHVHCDPNVTFDVGGRSTVASTSSDSLHRLSVHDDVEPDSLSDASKSDDGSIVERKRRPLSGREVKKSEDRLPTKPTSFYIGSVEAEPQPDFGGSDVSTAKTEAKQATKPFSTSTLTKPEKVRPSASAPVLSPESKEGASAVLFRQESFTKARPSNAGLPNISSLQAQSGLDPEAFRGASNQDTHSYLKETEDVLAALEAKLQAGRSGTTPSPIMDSLSAESDVDTSSTVSQHSNKTRPSALPKNPSVSGFHVERSSAGVAAPDPGGHSATSEKRRSQGEDGNNKTEPVRRPVVLRRSVGRCGSTDLSDDPPSLPYSDQESNSYRSRGRYAAPVQKEDAARTSRAPQGLHRASSFSAPRPTRASTLRRARLGEASDNEGPEAERPSPEAAQQQPQETKKLSRLDLLAMPRRRTNSFNTPSDTEASSPAGSSARRGSVSGSRPGERPQKASANKAPITRGRSSSAKCAGSTSSHGSRRRHKGSDYTSTSDEEYDSNQSTPKHKRSQPSSASHSPRNPARPQPVVALLPTPRSRESEDENHEADAAHGWTNHSSEIARLSQDLAKDLAILAREIHEVAGDGDPQNPGVESRARLSTVTAHEQLVPHIPEAGLKYQREPPRSSRKPEESDQEHSGSQRAPSRDEVLVDNLMLSSVSQITVAIRENTEQLADKMKALFQDRMDIWEEIEAKAHSDNDVPVNNSSNKEIASILKELGEVHRRLEVFNAVMGPSGQCDTSKASPGVRPSRPPGPRDWRTIHSVSRRGGGPRPSENVRRAAATPADQRAGYLV